MKRFVPLTRKINLIIVGSLVVGIGAVILYFAYSQNESLRHTTQAALRQQSDLLYQSIKNAMLPGEAPIAVRLFADIRSTNPAYQIFLYRANGVEAFSDNATIDAVNAQAGGTLFKRRAELPAEVMVKSDDAVFRRAVEERRNQSASQAAGGRSYFTIYKPLINHPNCTRCHGSTHTVRGVIGISADITPVVSQQQRNVLLAASFFLVVVVALAIVLSAYLHGTLIRPVKHIGEVCATVTRGDFSASVRVNSGDEIGALGETVNKMVQGLYERFKLSKYVSSTTIESLRGQEKGARRELALLFSDVRSFTSFSESNPPERVVESLNRLLNTQTRLIQENGGDVDKYVGDAVMAIFSGQDRELRACRSALLIQNELARDPQGYGGLRVGVGIHAGEVIQGMIGSERRADFTVIGDHVNLASRLCSSARPGMILVSEEVCRRTGPGARTRGPYLLKLKGKDQPQRVYQLLGLKGGGG